MVDCVWGVLLLSQEAVARPQITTGVQLELPEKFLEKFGCLFGCDLNSETKEAAADSIALQLKDLIVVPTEVEVDKFKQSLGCEDVSKQCGNPNKAVIAVPDPDFDPVIVLIGEDNDNKTAVVVLGNEANINETDEAGIIAQVIDSFAVTNQEDNSEDEDVAEEDYEDTIPTYGRDPRNYKETNKNSGDNYIPIQNTQPNNKISNGNNFYGQIESETQIKKETENEKETKYELSEEETEIQNKPVEESYSSFNDAKSETKFDKKEDKQNAEGSNEFVSDDNSNKDKILKPKPRYINSDQFRQKHIPFNPPRGFQAEEARRTRKAKTVSNLSLSNPWNVFLSSSLGCPAAMTCVEPVNCGPDGYVLTGRLGAPVRSGGRGMLRRCEVTVKQERRNGFCCKVF